MPRKVRGHQAVEIGGDLYTIGGYFDDGNGGRSGYQTAIDKISCSSRVCTWSTVNQQLNIGRSNAVAIPVMDALCTTN